MPDVISCDGGPYILQCDRLPEANRWVGGVVVWGWGHRTDNWHHSQVLVHSVSGGHSVSFEFVMQTPGRYFNHQSGQNFSGEYNRLFVSHSLLLYKHIHIFMVNAEQFFIYLPLNLFTYSIYSSIMSLFSGSCEGFCRYSTHRQFCVFF